MNPDEFDEDVAAFLEGGVTSKMLARTRSTKHGAVGMHQEDAVRSAMQEHGMLGDPDLERFMNGKISESTHVSALHPHRPGSLPHTCPPPQAEVPATHMSAPTGRGPCYTRVCPPPPMRTQIGVWTPACC